MTNGGKMIKIADLGLARGLRESVTMTLDRGRYYHKDFF